jgi:hypothetical protein
VFEGEVDHSLGRLGSFAQDVKVVNGAAQHLCSRNAQGRCGLIGSGESEDLMVRTKQFGDDGASNPT